MRSSLRRLSILVGVLGLALVTFTAHATVMRKLSRGELIRNATGIVRAHVVAQRAEWNQSTSTINTLTELAIDESLKGRQLGRITIRQIGGELGGRTLRVPGSGELRVGQEVVLFLREQAGQWYLSDLAQSVFYVTRAGGRATVQRNLEGASFAVTSAQGMTMIEGRREKTESLGHLLSEIRSLLRRAE